MIFNSKYITPALLAASMVSAAPLVNRQEATYDDATILQYALTLEHLEATFYREALNALSAEDFSAAGHPDWVRQRFTQIAADEKAHVDYLTAGLTAAGATPVAECTYNFGNLDVATFIATSQTFEGVGVGAYLGAAPSISNKAYLGAAGSILIVEAQHQAWAVSAADIGPAFPKPFAAGLDFNQVYTIVAPFFVSCPASNPALPFHTFPAFEVATPGPEYCVGQTLDIKIPQDVVDAAKAQGQTLYAAFVSEVGTVYQELDGTCGSVVIPPGVGGESFLIIVNGEFLCDAATVAGPVILNVSNLASDVSYE